MVCRATLTAVFDATDPLTVFFFFFSSRRRHTRCLSDWSSDVCSSDLFGTPSQAAANAVPKGNTVLPKKDRSEEHTSELQSLRHLVCRLLLEKKKTPTEKISNPSYSERPRRRATR